jgi:hypothetical protein
MDVGSLYRYQQVVCSAPSRTCSWAVVFAAALFVSTQNAVALSSVSSMPGWGGNLGITGFSDGADFTRTAGQSFRVNEGPVLVTRISFPVYAYAPIDAAGASDFQVGVVAWNGTQPTGPLLYLSDHLVGSGGNWQNFAVTPDNLVLQQGQQYLLFFTPNNFQDGVFSDSSMGYVPDNSYADGQYYYLYFYAGGTRPGISDLLINTWTPASADLAFAVEYQMVPEPGTAGILGLGVAVLLPRRRAKPTTAVCE